MGWRCRWNASVSFYPEIYANAKRDSNCKKSRGSNIDCRLETPPTPVLGDDATACDGRRLGAFGFTFGDGEGSLRFFVLYQYLESAGGILHCYVAGLMNVL